MGESVCLHLADFGFGPMTHFNENVSRYVGDHLQAEVLTMLCGWDCAPSLRQENSMSQIGIVLSTLLLILKQLGTTYCLLK